MSPSRGESRQKVYEFVRSRLLAGRSPSVREIQKALGFRAVQSAQTHLEALVAEGRLLKEGRGRARAYALPGGLHPQRPTVLVPLLGRVQAGALTTAIQEPEDYLTVRSRHPARELFALRVRGQSMKNAGILDGDLVVVRRQAQAESGQIVVALVEDEATVKRLRLQGGRVQLVPENPDFEVMEPDPRELRLLGRVVEVRRFLEDSGSLEASMHEDVQE